MTKKRILPPDRLAECKAAHDLFLAKKNTLKLSQRKIADAAGMTAAAVNLYFKGINPLNAQFAAVLSDQLQEPIESFSPRLSAEIAVMAAAAGHQRRQIAPPRDGAAAPIETIPIAGHDLFLGIDNAPHGPDENGSPSKKDYALIPQYTARASAGKGYHNDHIELSEGQGLVFKRDWLKRLSLKEGTSCVIYAEGSSMEPTISDGDVLLIDRASTEPRSGKVYAIHRPDGSVSVKRLVQTFAGGWVVRSDNPDKTLYPDEPISADDLLQIEIIGRSVWGGGGM